MKGSQHKYKRLPLQVGFFVTFVSSWLDFTFRAFVFSRPKTKRAANLFDSPP